MTDIIRLLPANVANQIAAGEVVQRPASAVKELLENAIDAGADHIILRIRDAGKELIHVIDNGKGMSPNDARMAFERHATSKISQPDDLFNLTTKGFRGEALASITAVSQVELKTKQHDAEIGTRLLVESSQVKLQEPEVCAEGASIAVSNLFYNIPARRNFLRSNAIESKHIIEEFHRVALAHPGIRFEMITNNSETYVLLPSGVRQRIVSIFGKKYNERLVPLDEVTDVVKISGFISKPEFTRKKRGEQFFFVNGRFIKSSYLNHAVQSSYAELIGSDEFPSWFVFLDIDPARIDINIHPTKTEVKFEDERPIYAILHSAVRSSLGRFNIKPSIDFEVDPIFDQVFSKERTIKPPTVSINTAYNPFESEQNSSKPQKRIEEFFVWSGSDGSKKVDYIFSII